MQNDLCEKKYSVLKAAMIELDGLFELESTLSGLLGVLRRELETSKGFVSLYDLDSIISTYNVFSGFNPEELSLGTGKMGEEEVRRVLQTPGPFCLTGRSSGPVLWNGGGAALARDEIRFFAVPFFVESHYAGIIAVDRIFNDSVPTSKDVDVLVEYAEMVQLAVSLGCRSGESRSFLMRENLALRNRLTGEGRFEHLLGRSSVMVDVQRRVEKVATTNATVLVIGERGVGKKLTARTVHDYSDRSGGPFVVVNCAEFLGQDLEHEIFGFEKGAFPGAFNPSSGALEEADGGTLLLENVEALPLNIQMRLQQFIQDRSFVRNGGETKFRTSDIRIVATSSADLGAMVEDGKFRLELYYLLNVYPIKIVPLRSRRDDITGLLNHFIREISIHSGRNIHFSPPALEALMRYDWPGNVQEMEELIKRLALMAEEDGVSLEFLTPFLSGGFASEIQSNGAGRLENGSSLSEIERNEVVSALERNGWVQYKAAKDLGLTARQVGYRIRKFNLERMVSEGRSSLRKT
jgi:Nif-specific regulatory protein